MTERTRLDSAALPEGMFARAWAMTRKAFANLIVVRKVDDKAGSIVTADEAQVRASICSCCVSRRARRSMRHDDRHIARRSPARGSGLGEFFELSEPGAQALLEQIQQLEPIDIDPQLPDISGSSRALQRLLPARPGPE